MFYVTLNTQRNVLVYNFSESEKNPITDLDCKGGRPTCHKINKVQSSPKSRSLELLIGFHTGDIAIHNALTKTNVLYNKERQIDKTGVRCVSWGSSAEKKEGETFLVGHENGNIYVYNKSIQEESPLIVNTESKIDEKQFFVLHNKTKRTNPITRYHVSNKAINDMKFSPNGRMLAAVSDDGYLYIIDYVSSKLNIMFQSFYGGILCCCWSPDGKYVVTGGEDDLISVYDIQARSILARGIGHSSYVSAVLFDNVQCDNDRYRIVSVGQDTRLILWDLDKINSNDEKGVDIDQKKKNTVQFKEPKREETLLVKALPQNEVPYFEPVSMHRAHVEPIRDVVTFMEGIITVCNQNIIKFWARPTNNRSEEEVISPDAVLVQEIGDHPKDQDDHHDLDMSVDEHSEKCKEEE